VLARPGSLLPSLNFFYPRLLRLCLALRRDAGLPRRALNSFLRLFQGLGLNFQDGFSLFLPSPRERTSSAVSVPCNFSQPTDSCPVEHVFGQSNTSQQIPLTSTVSSRRNGKLLPAFAPLHFSRPIATPALTTKSPRRGVVLSLFLFLCRPAHAPVRVLLFPFQHACPGAVCAPRSCFPIVW